ncbi:hypothetical protein AGDE_10934 [Angomonas deanei]|nr:hypothetical protein AGDE_10934 [Angomonas deanei]|eukprot:EPY27101.1 hypothetical protein AGDE_10934 [Angomonas deanei]
MGDCGVLHGGDLKSIIAQEEKLSDSSVRAFGGDIANGLAFMHSQGILNNDLKPSNLLMDATATLRYYDFSLSCTFEKAADRPLVGSPLYMAPELFLMGRPASSMASDMWSFGCVLYEMTTGTPCFNGATLSELITSILTKPFKPIAGANPHLNNILKTTLEKNPFQRATWADIAASPYWENQLNLPTSFPPQPAFDALKSSYSKNTVDTRTAVARAVQTQTGEVRSSGRLSVDGTANVETNFDKETNFADLAPTAAAVSNGDSKAEESANTSKLANRRPSQRANSLPGKGTSDNDTNAVPNRRGATMAQKQYQSATSGTTRKLSGGTDDRFTKLQIDAFNGGAFAKINIESVLSHTSDAHIRPLCMNNRIEHYVEKQYNAQTLTFKPLTLKEVKALNGTELTQFVTTIYKPLSSSSVSHEDKLNIMRYFEGICPDATTANILVNSSVMTLCVKLAGQMDAPAVFRETAASIMGILVRHTTFIHVRTWPSQTSSPIRVKLCKKETDMGVKRKLIACVGEFLSTWRFAQKRSEIRGILTPRR